MDTGISHPSNEVSTETPLSSKTEQSPAPLTSASWPLPLEIPKNLDGTQRVVKKMMFIDPKKLQKAGLDKKIAEALSKTKATAKDKGISGKNVSQALKAVVPSTSGKLAHVKALLNHKLVKKATPVTTSVVQLQDPAVSFKNKAVPSKDIFSGSGSQSSGDDVKKQISMSQSISSEVSQDSIIIKAMTMEMPSPIKKQHFIAEMSNFGSSITSSIISSSRVSPLATPHLSQQQHSQTLQAALSSRTVQLHTKSQVELQQRSYKCTQSPANTVHDTQKTFVNDMRRTKEISHTKTSTKSKTRHPKNPHSSKSNQSNQVLHPLQKKHQQQDTKKLAQTAKGTLECLEKECLQGIKSSCKLLHTAKTLQTLPQAIQLPQVVKSRECFETSNVSSQQYSDATTKLQSEMKTFSPQTKTSYSLQKETSKKSHISQPRTPLIGSLLRTYTEDTELSADSGKSLTFRQTKSKVIDNPQTTDPSLKDRPQTLISEDGIKTLNKSKKDLIRDGDCDSIAIPKAAIKKTALSAQKSAEDALLDTTSQWWSGADVNIAHNKEGSSSINLPLVIENKVLSAEEEYDITTLGLNSFTRHRQVHSEILPSTKQNTDQDVTRPKSVPTSTNLKKLSPDKIPKRESERQKMVVENVATSNEPVATESSIVLLKQASDKPSNSLKEIKQNRTDNETVIYSSVPHVPFDSQTQSAQHTENRSRNHIAQQLQATSINVKGTSVISTASSPAAVSSFTNPSCFSAVDFIASLSLGSKALPDDSGNLEMSADELLMSSLLMFDSPEKISSESEISEFSSKSAVRSISFSDDKYFSSSPPSEEHFSVEKSIENINFEKNTEQHHISKCRGSSNEKLNTQAPVVATVVRSISFSDDKCCSSSPPSEEHFSVEKPIENINFEKNTKQHHISKCRGSSNEKLNTQAPVGATVVRSISFSDDKCCSSSTPSEEHFSVEKSTENNNFEKNTEQYDTSKCRGFSNQKLNTQTPVVATIKKDENVTANVVKSVKISNFPAIISAFAENDQTLHNAAKNSDICSTTAEHARKIQKKKVKEIEGLQGECHVDCSVEKTSKKVDSILTDENRANEVLKVSKKDCSKFTSIGEIDNRSTEVQKSSLQFITNLQAKNQANLDVCLKEEQKVCAISILSREPNKSTNPSKIDNGFSIGQQEYVKSTTESENRICSHQDIKGNLETNKDVPASFTQDNKSADKVNTASSTDVIVPTRSRIRKAKVNLTQRKRQTMATGDNNKLNAVAPEQQTNRAQASSEVQNSESADSLKQEIAINLGILKSSKEIISELKKSTVDLKNVSADNSVKKHLSEIFNVPAAHQINEGNAIHVDVSPKKNEEEASTSGGSLKADNSLSTKLPPFKTIRRELRQESLHSGSIDINNKVNEVQQSHHQDIGKDNIYVDSKHNNEITYCNKTNSVLFVEKVFDKSGMKKNREEAPQLETNTTHTVNHSCAAEPALEEAKCDLVAEIDLPKQMKIGIISEKNSIEDKIATKTSPNTLTDKGTKNLEKETESPLLGGVSLIQPQQSNFSRISKSHKNPFKKKSPNLDKAKNIKSLEGYNEAAQLEQTDTSADISLACERIDDETEKQEIEIESGNVLFEEANVFVKVENSTPKGSSRFSDVALDNQSDKVETSTSLKRNCISENEGNSVNNVKPKSVEITEESAEINKEANLTLITEEINKPELSKKGKSLKRGIDIEELPIKVEKKRTKNIDKKEDLVILEDDPHSQNMQTKNTHCAEKYEEKSLTINKKEVASPKCEADKPTSLTNKKRRGRPKKSATLPLKPDEESNMAKPREQFITKSTFETDDGGHTSISLADISTSDINSKMEDSSLLATNLHAAAVVKPIKISPRKYAKSKAQKSSRQSKSIKNKTTCSEKCISSDDDIDEFLGFEEEIKKANPLCYANTNMSHRQPNILNAESVAKIDDIIEVENNALPKDNKFTDSEMNLSYDDLPTSTQQLQGDRNGNENTKSKRKSPKSMTAKSCINVNEEQDSSAVILKNWLNTMKPSQTTAPDDSTDQIESPVPASATSTPLKISRSKRTNNQKVNSNTSANVCQENSSLSLKKRWEITHQNDLKAQENNEDGSEPDEDREFIKISPVKKRKNDKSGVTAAKKSRTTTKKKQPETGSLLFLSNQFNPKRGRPKKADTTTTISAARSVALSVAESLSLMLPPASHAAQRPFRKDSEFNSRLLLIRDRSLLDSNEPVTASYRPKCETPAGGIQCGLCLEFTSEDKWMQHISDHYGIGWIAGQPEVNVTSRATVLSAMLYFYKESKVKGLNCRMCQRLYRSALGLLTHIETCGLSDEQKKSSRVSCEFCFGEYSKLSFPAHLRTCAAKINQEMNIEEINNDLLARTEAVNNVGRLKRRSVIKAEIILKSLGGSLSTGLESNFCPNDFIKYIPPLPSTSELCAKWTEEIKKFGKAYCSEKFCQFTTSDVDAMTAHISCCTSIMKPGYYCTKCNRFSSEVKEHIIKHINKLHKPRTSVEKPQFDPQFNSADECCSSDDYTSESILASGTDDDLNNFSTTAIKNKNKKIQRQSISSTNNNTSANMKYKRIFPDRLTSVTLQCRQRMKFFVQKHFASNALFLFAIPVINLVPSNDHEQYSAKSPISMSFCYSNERDLPTQLGVVNGKTEWEQLRRYEVAQEKSEQFLYVGGPIKSLAWAPLSPDPSQNLDHYLAIAFRKSTEKFSRVLNPKITPTLILIYKCDPKLVADNPGQVLYGLTIDNGPIHHIEFLPSGGYEPELNRLGLLAVATVQTEVRVYPLPLRTPENDENDSITLIQVAPAFVLTLDLSGSPNCSPTYDSHCLKLVWSQVSGHTHIFGAYHNGFIAIWDISDEEDANLNQFVIDGVRHFVPLNYFFCGEKEPTSLNIHYDTNGARWLFVSTVGRKLFLYDIHDMANPILQREDVAKNFVNAMDWPIYWENPTYVLGDILTSFGSCMMTLSPMTIIYSQRKSAASLCGLNDLHFNPWNNSYANGAENGDLSIVPMREMNLDVGGKTTSKSKLISVLDIHRLDGKPIPKRLEKTPNEDWQMFEPDYAEKYGIVFRPLIKLNPESTNSYSENRLPPINLNRYMRINQVRFDLNEANRSLLAVGYENGFVRILLYRRETYFP